MRANADRVAALKGHDFSRAAKQRERDEAPARRLIVSH
jgi:hypothetical protein